LHHVCRKETILEATNAECVAVSTSVVLVVTTICTLIVTGLKVERRVPEELVPFKLALSCRRLGLKNKLILLKT
jgi:hypothetical protein